MGFPYSYINRILLTFLLFCTTTTVVYAQQTPSRTVDTTQPRSTRLQLLRDSTKATIDTTIKTATALAKTGKDALVQSFKSKKSLLPSFSRLSKPTLPAFDSAQFDIYHPYKKLFHTKPLLRLNGGYVSYQFNYRSAIDTPYTEKDIAQHNITGNLQLTVAGHLPIRVSWWSRQSNSTVFRDITDVQVAFDGNAFQQQLQASLRQRLLAMAGSLKDSLSEKLYGLKTGSLDDLRKKLTLDFAPQSLVEAHELLHVPRITWQPGVPDSINTQREDSLKKIAAFFLDTYKKTKGEYDRLEKQVDSLKEVLQQNEQKIRRFKQMVGGNMSELINAPDWKDKLSSYGLQQAEIPARYRWLLGVRQFSLGRSVTNYSELTVKNMSVNGLNFEYNSWYYVALTAGVVDYRYRDFVVNGANKKPQYLYMVRAGIGSLQKNYFILSAFRGQKQLFASGGLSTITVTGLSAEARMKVNKTTWVTAEIAKSMAPDFRNNPAKENTTLSLSDKTNQAYALKLYSYFPATNTRVEGFYKHTGANYQSFSSFQTNAALESWTLKAEQAFFKKKLRLAGSLRKNEYSNDFLPQQYSSNTIFKSLTASLRMRKWPVVTVGYQPMSQLTKVDSLVVENRFQVLTSSAYHIYKIKQLRTATTLMLNKFYNNSSDTGYLYYNATNLYWAQQFFFKAFTAQVAMAYTSNAGYTLVTMDEGIQLNLNKLGTLGFGVKINSLNKDLIKAGAYINGNIRLYKQDFITLHYERGYLPGFNKSLIRNEMGSIQYVKSF